MEMRSNGKGALVAIELVGSHIYCKTDSTHSYIIKSHNLMFSWTLFT